MWVITTDPVWTRVAIPDGPANQSMSGMANMVEAFQCWGERGWVNPGEGGLLFPTEKAAGEYMASNKMNL
ncbi:hypothetical protein PX52LOC_07650 [Limnoglobus roseus]|uniref:Uncharacterized protein n=2 Tax=Limnoglobus roseus TaxID=2598579 RepID=A0A5C1APM8_9BACT|nr:hypothetical protein PX52LOC_07650 [Limnoglobus roseus]